MLSVKYRSSDGVSSREFEDMIQSVSEVVSQRLEIEESNYIFELQMDGVHCMCAIVLVTTNPITECQLIIMTNQGRKPSDMKAMEPIHEIIEKVFLVGCD